MDRFKEIEQLLFYFRDLYSQNPTEPIDWYTIYSTLCTYGLSKDSSYDSSNQDSRFITNLWQEWIYFFQNNPGINVEHFASQEKFLQFYQKGKGEDLCDCYKLYLSFPKDKMEAAVKDIFSFIASNNMVNGSKVANRTRSDSIVLRIVHMEDAIKVINYINSNPNLYLNALPTNPFVQRYGVVGFGYDYTMSYNSVISDLIANYIAQKRTTNTFETVSFNDFKSYVDNLYLDLLNGVDLEQNVYNVIKGEYQSLSKEGRILNLRNIIEMISDSLDSRKTINDYLLTVEKFKNPEVKKTEIENIKNQLYQNEIPRENQFNQQQVNLLKNYIIYVTQKFNNDEEQTFGYLANYLNGNINGITRDNNFRELFAQYLTPEIARQIVGQNVKIYISHVMKDYNRSKDDKFKMIFDKACEVTLRKYGEGHLICALNNGLMGNYKWFSNDENVRVDMIHNLPKGYFNIYAQEKLESLTSQRVR